MSFEGKCEVKDAVRPRSGEVRPLSGWVAATAVTPPRAELVSGYREASLNRMMERPKSTTHTSSSQALASTSAAPVVRTPAWTGSCTPDVPTERRVPSLLEVCVRNDDRRGGNRREYCDGQSEEKLALPQQVCRYQRHAPFRGELRGVNC